MIAERDRLIAERDAASGPMPPCPSWCTMRAGHGWDGIGDRGRARSHQGPDFGPFLATGADEYAEEPGVLAYDVWLIADATTMRLLPRQLLDLASQAIAAAQWLEAHR